MRTKTQMPLTDTNMKRTVTVVYVLMTLFRSDADHVMSRTKLDMDYYSGTTKVGGSHKELPPCKFDGKQLLHHNTSCVYKPVPNDGYIHRNDSVSVDDLPRGKTSSDDGRGKTTSDDGRGSSGQGRAADGKETLQDKKETDPYAEDGKYWLVPPFMIGACSVAVVYITIHCLYMHCYTKRKMRQLAHRNMVPQAIIFSDGDGPSVSSTQSCTAVVNYDGVQPFIVYHAGDSPGTTAPEVSTERTASTRKKSIHLQLPERFRNRGRPRPSVCSANATMETSTSSTGKSTSEDTKLDMRRPTRASICYLPVSHTNSDQTGGIHEWTPLQGFLYPSVMLPRKASVSIASGSGSSISRDEPFILIPNPAVSGEQINQRHESDSTNQRRESAPNHRRESESANHEKRESESANQRWELESTNQRRESEGTRLPSSRKTSFKDPESETVTIPPTSYPEDD